MSPLQGEYEPSPYRWVREQVAEYEASGGRRANTLRDTGLPIIVVTTRGNKTGKLRKSPLMRVEHDGEYLIVASKGGSHEHPAWYYNVRAHPHVELQDGAEKHDYVARALEGAERETWWARAVDAYPPYAAYQKRTDRLIPIFLLTRVTL
jgi:deazaflavin-dependent oxidoreductase (nitroreductase family)